MEVIRRLLLMLPEVVVSNKRLALAASLTAVAALAILFYYASQLQPKSIGIAEALVQPVNTYVQVIGSVRSIRSSSGSVSLSLCEASECISVFMPSASADDLRTNPYLLKVGDRLVVRGRVQAYRGEKEIVPFGGNGIELI